LSTVMHVENLDAVSELIYQLCPGYSLFVFNLIILATFYGLGKTHFILVQTLVANIFYVIYYDLIHQDIIGLSLRNIVIMFNIGMGLASAAAGFLFYFMFRKKVRIDEEVAKNLRESPVE